MLTDEGLRKIEDNVFIDNRITIAEAKLLLIKIRHLQQISKEIESPRLDLTKISIKVPESKSSKVSDKYKQVNNFS